MNNKEMQKVKSILNNTKNAEKKKNVFETNPTLSHLNGFS